MTSAALRSRPRPVEVAPRTAPESQVTESEWESPRSETTALRCRATPANPIAAGHKRLLRFTFINMKRNHRLTACVMLRHQMRRAPRYTRRERRFWREAQGMPLLLDTFHSLLGALLETEALEESPRP